MLGLKSKGKNDKLDIKDEGQLVKGFEEGLDMVSR